MSSENVPPLCNQECIWRGSTWRKRGKMCNKYFYMLLAQIKVYAQSDPFNDSPTFMFKKSQNESEEWEFIDKMFDIHSTLSFAIHHHRINIFFCIQSMGRKCVWQLMSDTLNFFIDRRTVSDIKFYFFVEFAN